MSEEEIKQIWDNLFNKLNETEKTFLAIISNEKNKQIEELKSQLQQKENIIKEVRDYFKNHTLKYDDLMLIKPSDVLEILDSYKGSDEIGK